MISLEGLNDFHGFDFATQNLGAREEFLHLIRKPPPLRKTVGFPNPCGNFSTKSRPTTPKVKVVRPEQIRLLLERATRFAGGGSRQFNHFLTELAARTDSQVARANLSITSLQNWPQARFVRN